MTRAVDPPLLDHGAGRGPSDGRLPVDSDPWDESTWSRPARSVIEWRHRRARKAQTSHRFPSRGDDIEFAAQQPQLTGGDLRDAAKDQAIGFGDAFGVPVVGVFDQHGALAERSLLGILPDLEEFPLEHF